MYRLTARMRQNLRMDLTRYHGLFTGGRCSGWELEELIVRAIQSDTQSQHHVRWTEKGHDDFADILVGTDETEYPVQIKSGELKGGYLTLSGHRLGRYKGNMHAISEYLNTKNADILAVPYYKIDDDAGRTHVYRVGYISIAHMIGLSSDGWKEVGTTHVQINTSGVVFTIRTSMSWQIWWKVPERLMELTDLMKIS